ncbi:MAG: molybdopterin-dependent oxidoreductase [Chloroflexi bacterium]|nr:molybdopterin-dependent oxidoreductase [Chloroflexota bacterium]
MKPAQIEEVPSFCIECYNYCPVKVRVENGVISKIEGNPVAPHTEGRLCPKGNAALMRVYDPHRLKVPLQRTNPEKGVGIDPKWQEISWDQALDIVTEKLKQQRAANPKGLKMPSMELSRLPYFFCWGFAYGTTNVHLAAGTGGGVQCGNAGHTLGTQLWGSFHDWPEYKYTKYALFIGTNTGFESDRSIPVDGKRIADARIRGMKLVVVDPRFTHAAAKADEWVPIRPATDGAFVLGIVNLLLNDYGVYDAEYLRRHTNAPYLIAPDGYCVRDPETRKPVIWDSVDGQAKPFDLFNPEGAAPRAALEGRFQVNGIACQPAFQMLKERVTEYSPERVEEITTVPAATLRRIAREFGENTQIGSTIEIEGHRWPLRGSMVVFYRGTQSHVHSTLTTQAINTLQLVVGAMGPPGGTGRWFFGTRLKEAQLVPNADGVVSYDIHMFHPLSAPTWPPTEYDLGNYLPFDVLGASHLHYVTGVEPEAWGLDPRTMILSDATNPIMTVGDLKKIEAYYKRNFVVQVEQYMTETSQLADILLPTDFQLERNNLQTVQAGSEYLGLLYARPAIKPQHQARDFWDMALEVGHRLGLLYGENGFNYWANAFFRLKPEYKLSLEERYTLAQIQERLAKNMIGEDGWQKLVADGVYARKIPAVEKYMPFQPARIALYNEDLKRTGDQLVASLKQAGAYDRLKDDIDFADYDALPRWKPGPVHQADDKYDLFAVNGKSVLFTFARLAFNPWLMEVAERDPYVLKVWVNRTTAQKKGIADGQRIWVESANGKVLGEAKVTEGMHPECVGIAGVLGHWCDHPIAKGKGTHFNSLVGLSLKNTDPIATTMEGAAVRVRVYAAD